MDIPGAITECRYIDQIKLAKQYKNILKITDPLTKKNKLIELNKRIEQSKAYMDKHRLNIPDISYPDLPILLQKEKIINNLNQHQVLIVAGETGSGKSTQLSKICLEAGYGVKGMVAHTQPRRIAAVSIAQRVASELKRKIKQGVGYKIRFKDQTTPNDYIQLLTDGMLLAQTQTDRLLMEYEVIIVDEAHERSLNIDILLGLIKRILIKRPELKVIITSATIQLEKFSKFFNNAPIIEVSGRQYPVETVFLHNDVSESKDEVAKIIDAVKVATRQGLGDILIFQSGEKEIREVVQELNNLKLKSTIVLPLFSRLTQAQQLKIFRQSPGRKIVVATNIAETAITVPNIRFVIDSGFHKINRYNPRSKLHRLEIETISQANLTQRKGRCGRVGPGIYYPMFSEEDSKLRDEYTAPEILRSSLAKVLLSLFTFGIKSAGDFPFIDPPEQKYIKDGLRLLERLQAIDETHRLTKIGRLMARMPIEPRVARIIIEAHRQNCLKEILIIGSVLSMVDPRETPFDKREQAREKHSQYKDNQSEFITYLNLWEQLHLDKKNLTHKAFVKQCQQNYLSYIRVCEWIDLHNELTKLCEELKFNTNQKPGTYEQIHKAIITGFVDFIGQKEDAKLYLGARGLKFMIHPGSLIKKKPSWIIAGEIFHTTKTFAKNIASIESKWLAQQAPHLLKKTYLDPKFDLKKQTVVAKEQSKLFGLIVHHQIIDYFKKNPKVATQIFIREALVEDQLDGNLSFYKNNLEVQKRLKALQQRVRFKKIFLDEEFIFEFYANLFQDNVGSLTTLKSWIKNNGEKKLFFSFDDFISKDDYQRLLISYPDQLKLEELNIPISYCYDPDSENDGATLQIPLKLVPFLLQYDLSWIIPAWLKEKVTLELKNIPKAIRKTMPPLKTVIDEFIKTVEYGQGNYYDAIIQFLSRNYGVHLKKQDFIQYAAIYPQHLKWHFTVINQDNKILCSGDDLDKIYHELKAKKYFDSELIMQQEDNLFTDWTFSDLEISVKKAFHDKQITVYPAVIEQHDGVKIDFLPSLELAQQYHAMGLLCLFKFNLQKEISYLKRSVTDKAKFKRAMKILPQGSNSIEDLIEASLLNCFIVNEPNIRTKDEFIEQLSTQRKNLVPVFNKLLKLFGIIVEGLDIIYLKLKSYQSQAVYKMALQDIDQQLKQLFEDKFLLRATLPWLLRYPIYLKAILLRLEKLTKNQTADRKATQDIQELQLTLKKKIESNLSNIKDTLLLPVSEESKFFHSINWKIQELRISLFAQSLGTIMPVSKQKIIKELGKK